jgi:exodeoxyribonuclease VII large subunit
MGIEAVVLARGGGSREDLAVFDHQELALCLANCPMPVVSGIGHEDDTTIADLVADLRAATPTAAVVALLPDRVTVRQGLRQQAVHLGQLGRARLQGERQRLGHQRERLEILHPRSLLVARRAGLLHAHQLARGFSLVHNADGQLVRSIQQLKQGDLLALQLGDGQVGTEVREIYGPAEPVES